MNINYRKTSAIDSAYKKQPTADVIICRVNFVNKFASQEIAEFSLQFYLFLKFVSFKSPN